MLSVANNAVEEDRTYITLVKGRNCAAILGTEKIGEISIPFIWGLRVHKSCSLLRLQQNGVISTDSKLANGVWSTEIGGQF